MKKQNLIIARFTFPEYEVHWIPFRFPQLGNLEKVPGYIVNVHPNNTDGRFRESKSFESTLSPNKTNSIDYIKKAFYD